MSPQGWPGPQEGALTFLIVSGGAALAHLPCLCLPSGVRLKPQYREGASDPPSPLLLPSPGARKTITEKTLGGHEEAEDDHPGASPQREAALRDKRPETWVQRSLEPWGGVGLSLPPSEGLPIRPAHCSSSHRKVYGVQDISSSQNLPECQPA